MKNILLAGVAIIGLYFAFLRGPGYSLDVSEFDGSKVFNHTKYGYQIELPHTFYESDKDSPFRSNYLDATTHFRSETHGFSYFQIGVVKGKYLGDVKHALRKFESGEINEKELLKEVKNPGDKRKAFMVDGIPVYQKTDVAQRSDNHMVTLLINDELIQFAVIAPKNKEKELSKIMRSLRRI